MGTCKNCFKDNQWRNSKYHCSVS